MQITIKPYFRSVIIDGEEVREMVTPFPDFLNHLAAVSCEASDTSPHTITRVEGVHRYVTHFIAREYYYEHIGEFIDWFYIEKQAQLDKVVADQANLEQTVTDVIDPQLTQIAQTINSNEIRSLYYNTNLRTLNAVKGNSTLTATIPLVSTDTAGLMTEVDFTSFKSIEREVNNLIKKGSWRATYPTYEDMLEANPDLRVQDSSWGVGDFVYVQNDDHYDPNTVHTTSYSVTDVLGSDVHILAFNKVESTSITIDPATTTRLGVGRVATPTDMEEELIEDGPAFLAAGSDAEKLLLRVSDKYDIGEFYYFRHPTLKPGFAAAQGGLISGIYQGKNITEYPIWEYLQTAEGQLLCKTEAQWQAMTTATWATLADGSKVGWNGIGGAPYYVQDLGAGTLRMPDIRGMYAEAAGFNSLGVGDAQGDQMRRLVGSANEVLTGTGGSSSATGVLRWTAAGRFSAAAGGAYWVAHLDTDNNRVTPTGSVNAPKRWGALVCCYLGTPAS